MTIVRREADQPELIAGSDPLLDMGTLSELEIALGRTAVADMLGLVPRSLADEMQRIETALASGDLEGVRRCAHTLKGFSANLGLSRLSRAAMRLDRHVREFPRTAPQAGELAGRLAEVARDTVDALARRA